VRKGFRTSKKADSGKVLGRRGQRRCSNSREGKRENFVEGDRESARRQKRGKGGKGRSNASDNDTGKKAGKVRVTAAKKGRGERARSGGEAFVLGNGAFILGGVHLVRQKTNLG